MPLRLAARDAANIYLETDASPANIIDVYVFAPAVVEHAAVVEWLSERVAVLPIARRRLQRAAADIDYPAWVTDDTVDMRDQITVEAVADWCDARARIGSLVGTPMDLTRPPWDATVMTGVRGIGDGIPDGATVVVLRFHHSVGDAVATAAFGRAVFTGNVEGLRASGQQTEMAGAVRLAFRLPCRAAQFARSIGRAMIVARRSARAVARGEFATPPATSPPSIFNRPLQGSPTVGLVHFDLTEVRDIGRMAGGTVNDAILTVVGGALAELLDELGNPVDGSLGALMPIAMNDAVQNANRFALGSVVLHSDERDPVERLRRVQTSTASEKARQSHPALEQQRSLAQLVPAFITRRTGDRLRRRTEPVAKPGFGNTMVSNVPGGVSDGEFMGARIVDRFGVLTICHGEALTHFVSSAGDRISLSFTVDSAIMPTLGRYEGLLRSTFARLAAAVHAAA
ncbi:wax ester/triacylglycerol synthase domain-containing protein [Speluncibacter jeojiensis]|uniref:wax ester/triacylglycerol synthase domain-containing protein n=1 Tax=Speluncibacter jeojiensis TaxID=2710754 RepID=UPI0024107C7B|nr:wax ester/triacylglycerol synthase domain-containing protein [Rhodococcus sp. D2-41]